MEGSGCLERKWSGGLPSPPYPSPGRSPLRLPSGYVHLLHVANILSQGKGTAVVNVSQFSLVCSNCKFTRQIMYHQGCSRLHEPSAPRWPGPVENTITPKAKSLSWEGRRCWCLTGDKRMLCCVCPCPEAQSLAFQPHKPVPLVTHYSLKASVDPSPHFWSMWLGQW